MKMQLGLSKGSEFTQTKEKDALRQCPMGMEGCASWDPLSALRSPVAQLTQALQAWPLAPRLATPVPLLQTAQLFSDLAGWDSNIFRASKGHLLLSSESLTARKIWTFIKMDMRASSGHFHDKILFSHCKSSNFFSLNFKWYRQSNIDKGFSVPELTAAFLATIAASAAESTLGSGLEDVKPHLALPFQPSLLLLRLIFLARAARAEGRGTNI